MTFRPASPAPVKWKRWAAASEALPNLLLTTLAAGAAQAPFTAPADPPVVWRRASAQPVVAPNLLLTTLAPVQLYPARSSEPQRVWPRWRQYDEPPRPQLGLVAVGPFTATLPAQFTWPRYAKSSDEPRNLALLSPAAQAPFTGAIETTTWRLRTAVSDETRNLLPLQTPPAVQAPFNAVIEHGAWKRFAPVPDQPRNLALLTPVVQSPFAGTIEERAWRRASPQPDVHRNLALLSPAVQSPFSGVIEERAWRRFTPQSEDQRNLALLSIPPGVPFTPPAEQSQPWRYRLLQAEPGPNTLPLGTTTVSLVPDPRYTVRGTLTGYIAR